MQQLTIVMYHYVRELQYTSYPKIKGLLVSEFREQLKYIKKHYQFVTVEDCIEAIYSDSVESLPKNSILLTFDDAYIDHYLSVFPILEAEKIQGCFFPPAKAILNHEVLDVNKIHFLLAKADIVALLIDVNLCLDKYREEYSLQDNNYYFQKLATENRFDSKEIIFIKRLLQVELEESLRKIIVAELFKKYVTNDECSFSKELYMDQDQLRCMIRNGMYVGSHGYDHYFLNSLSPKKQEQEIDLSLAFLEKIGSPIKNWVMCYPYGAYNDSLIEIIKRKGCKIGLTTKVDIAKLNNSNAFTLERLDANDLPKIACAETNEWTKQVLSVALEKTAPK